MSQELPDEWFVTDGRTNAAITWLLIGILGATALEQFFAGRVPKAAFAAVATAVAIAPPLAARSWTHALHWPLLVVVSLPFVLGSLRPALLGQFFVSIGVAALGVLVVSALQLTTSLRMTPGFAVVFVVIGTLAVAGFWAVVAAFSATYLGGTFVETNDELMGIFSVALVAGFAAGLLLRSYFRWRLRRATASTLRGVDST